MSNAIKTQKRNDTGCEMEEYLDTPDMSFPSNDTANFDLSTKRTQPSSESSPTPRILVVDDDPLFRAQVRHLAAVRKLPVTVCSSMREMQVMADSSGFDVAIVDYYLDDLKTYLRGTDIASLLESTPVILISNSDHGIENSTPFPKSVRRFVNKRVGINAILDAAIQSTQRAA